MGLFTQKKKYKEPIESSQARKGIMSIASNAPEFGVKGTAGMSDLEQIGMDQATQYASGRSPEVSTALASLGQAGQYTNLMDVPEYAALLKTGQNNMAQELNRVGRSLQISGNNNTSSGANVMANRLGDLNTQLVGSLAPYAAQERERRFNAPLMAADLATNDQLSRIDTAGKAGQLPRALKQLEMDAQYMSDYLNEIAPFQYQVPAYSSIFGSGGQTVSGGGLSDLGFGLSTLAGMIDFNIGGKD